MWTNKLQISGWARLERQCETKATAPALGALDTHLPAMLLDNRFDNGQPQAVAFNISRLVGVHAVELVEDERQISSGDTKACVLHFDADSKLVTYIEKKLSKLLQYHDRITKVDVYLKLDNVVHNIKDKVAEIKVLIPRHEFFVKQSSKSFEESFDSALDSLITQIKRQKEKQAA